MAKRVAAPKTRNAGTMTDAAFRSWVRSQLRRMSLRWRPISEKRGEGQRPANDADKKRWGKLIRVVNTCEGCGAWVPKSRLEIDHIVPCGSITDIERDLGPFVMRMLCEKDGLRRLCPTCHQAVTNASR